MSFFEKLRKPSAPYDDEPLPPLPPHSEPEPDVPEPDDEIRELVRPVKV